MAIKVTNRTATGLAPYRSSLAGTLLAAREAVMAPIRPILRGPGVTEQQWRVLRVLSDEEPCEPSRLAQYALLHGPSVTRILKELTDRGLVVREANPADGRSSVLTLAPAGRSLIRETAAHTVELLEAYRRAFGAERLEALQKELVALTEAVSTFSEKVAADTD